MLEPTPCLACKRVTRTTAGLCPNCGIAKPEGGVPRWISPSARRLKPALLDVFGDLGAYLVLSILLSLVALAIGAVVLLGTAVALLVVVLVVAAGLVVAGLISGALG